MAVSSLLKVSLVALACVAAVSAPSAVATTTAASSVSCVNYATYFPYAQSASDCIVTNMCYNRTLCCPTVSPPDLSTCLDITTFTCDLEAACVNHTDDASWYPYTSDFGASVECCTATADTPTVAPARPGLESSDGTNTDGSSSGLAPTPVQTCDDTASQACEATNGFPSLIRAFCQDAIPPTYSDTYIVQSLPYVCCQYAAAPSASSVYVDQVGKTACGSALLELPRVGTYYCSMQGRAATVCCNGVISPDGSTDSSASSAAVGNTTYSYMSATCLYVPQLGDAASFVAASTATVVVMLVATTVLSALL